MVPHEEFTTDGIDTSNKSNSTKSGRRRHARRRERREETDISGTTGSAGATREDAATVPGRVQARGGAAGARGEGGRHGRHVRSAGGARAGGQPGHAAGHAGAWVTQTAIDAGRRDGLTTDERQELGQLRREVKRLHEEREILKKAAAFFAAESATR